MAWRFDIIACIMLCMRASYALYVNFVLFAGLVAWMSVILLICYNVQKSACTALLKVCLFDSSLVLNVCRTSFRRKVTFVRTRRWDSNPRMNALQINLSTEYVISPLEKLPSQKDWLWLVTDKLWISRTFRWNPVWNWNELRNYNLKGSWKSWGGLFEWKGFPNGMQ